MTLGGSIANHCQDGLFPPSLLTLRQLWLNGSRGGRPSIALLGRVAVDFVGHIPTVVVPFAN